uniref:Uncharacterized protein n=1 Tax=Branchiostoma floridae TaxID=7739 RepID=C3ZKP8_BRAFL|eukprot:XP_002590886.1 hypothetical protein BRAFLDRAFT_129595 [Branchiostoma floridae]
MTISSSNRIKGYNNLDRMKPRLLSVPFHMVTGVILLTSCHVIGENLVARLLVQRAGFSTSTRKALDNKVLEKQKIMQAPGGDMVYLKGGASDKIYYRTTMGMVIFGVGYSIFSLLAACLPKKSE